jgi:hypothetical protein
VTYVDADTIGKKGKKRYRKPPVQEPVQMLTEMEQLPNSAPVTEAYAAAFIGTSRGSLSNQRSKRIGPPFIANGNRHIRYLMGDLRAYRAARRKATV